jgi:hypothetical protein
MPRPAATPRAARMALLTAPFAGKAPSGRVWRRLRRARGSAQLEASGHRQVAPRGRYRPLLGTRQASFASSSWPLAGFRPRTRVGRARRALDCLRLGAPSGCRAGGLDARPNHGRHREPGAVAAKGDQVGEWSHVHLSAPDTGCCAQSAGGLQLLGHLHQRAGIAGRACRPPRHSPDQPRAAARPSQERPAALQIGLASEPPGV